MKPEGTGLVTMPLPPAQVPPVQLHHRPEAFSCQMTPFSKAISVTFAVYPATLPFSSTTPPVIVQTLPAASMMEPLAPAFRMLLSGEAAEEVLAVIGRPV